MSSALIGHTGFVGGNLRVARPFDVLVNSANVEELRGKSFDLVVCAGVRAEKWKANRAQFKQRVAAILAKVRLDVLVVVPTDFGKQIEKEDKTAIITEHVPVPLLIVIVAELLPAPEHAPDAAMTTTLPDAPPVAATVKLEPYVAIAGACCVTVMV